MIKSFIEKIESKILTKLFTRWVDKEYDVELLEMTNSVITTRVVELKTFVDMCNKVEIKGFRRDV
jgi:hypothetical protein|tara:strand:+ start:380 stop:574 length:195 start_codon:yes stop_codon:yes gene_type:complete